jgi:hypothetical protein
MSQKLDLPAVTIEQMIEMCPCKEYLGPGLKPTKLAMRLLAGREALTAIDVLDMEEVLARDKLWMVLREEFITVSTARQFALELNFTRIGTFYDYWWDARLASHQNVYRLVPPKFRRIMKEDEVRQERMRVFQDQCVMLRSIL